MPTVAEYLGLPKGVIKFTGNELLPDSGAVGIEVELENLNDELEGWPRVDGWEKKDDGSLRDGREYVFDGPQSGDTALASINAIAEALDGNVDPTFRCSTHIHLDIRDMEWSQYEKFVLAYMVFEDVFFDHCDAYRRQSNFCIPFQNNGWLAELFGRTILVREEHQKLRACQQWPKYSALNLQTTSSFGSVEFRGSHAMVSAVELIMLSQRMLFLKKFVMEDTSGSHVEFIKRLEGVDLFEVFPDGLAAGYVMNDGAKELGISSAWHAIVAATVAKAAEAAMEPLENPRRDPDRMARNTMASCMEQTGRGWHIATFQRLSLAAPVGGATFQKAFAIMDAMNRVNGINIKLSDLIDRPSRAHVDYMRHQIQDVRRFYGFANVQAHHID